jgi:putative transposase
MTHAVRWRVSRQTLGYGHLYQGRFKSFPVQNDGHYLNVCRYVERNARSAGLVERAEDWRWGSLWARTQGPPALQSVLSAGPLPLPTGWTDHVNEPLTRKEQLRLEESLRRGRPLGSDLWVARTVSKMGLEHTVRAPGRPKKVPV